MDLLPFVIVFLNVLRRGVELFQECFGIGWVLRPSRDFGWEPWRQDLCLDQCFELLFAATEASLHLLRSDELFKHVHQVFDSGCWEGELRAPNACFKVGRVLLCD
ncbi:hypothetical protein RA29_07705 [Tateyamaria sp. ANG-S1]|nr:hypothetical protein RA29_07705 [Tateyamaria sp. ANG-S1]